MGKSRPAGIGETETPITVLVVDDEISIRNSIAELLGACADSDEFEFLELAKQLFGDLPPPESTTRFDVVVRGQGMDALELIKAKAARNQQFDVVIMDINLPPGINGLKTAQEIRSIHPEIPIIFITGLPYADPRFIVSAGLSPRGIGYLEKPLRARELRHLILTLWSNSGELPFEEEITRVPSENSAANKDTWFWSARVSADGALFADWDNAGDGSRWPEFVAQTGKNEFKVSTGEHEIALADALRRLEENDVDARNTIVAFGTPDQRARFLLRIDSVKEPNSGLRTMLIVEIADTLVEFLHGYDLTITEAVIAIGLGMGARPKDLANALSTTNNTLKVHRHNAYQKLGVRRQTDLMGIFENIRSQN